MKFFPKETRLVGQHSMFAIVFLALLPWGAGNVFGQAALDRDRDRSDPPTLSVTGNGESFAAPDSATLRLGAIAEDKEATAAQVRVNETMQRALKALRGLNMADIKLKTAGLSLSPVYEQQGSSHGATRPRIIGYRAFHTLQVDVQNLLQIGRIIDAAVAAGANQVESLSFQLKDDINARRQALTRAVQEARAKADAIAEAMGVRIKGVREVIEGGVHLMQPRMELAQARFGGGQTTPVEPGEVRIQASVRVDYYITEGRTE